MAARDVTAPISITIESFPMAKNEANEIHQRRKTNQISFIPIRPEDENS